MQTPCCGCLTFAHNGTVLWAWTRAAIRRRLIETVVLAGLVGLAGGTVLAAAAGARRTATAYPRMLRSTNASDVLIASFGPGLLGLYDEIERLPEVLDSGKAAALIVSPVSPSGEATLLGGVSLASVDGRLGYRIHGFKLLAGRMPDPDSVTEVLANRSFARHAHVQAGQHVPMRLFGPNGPKDPKHVRPEEGIPLDLTIAGIGLEPEAVVPVSANDALPMLQLTPAFWRRYGKPTETAFDGILLRLKPGVDVRAFRRTVDAIAEKHPESGGRVLFSVQDEQAVRVERAIRPQAAALAAFAVIVGLAALLVLGQAISRHLLRDVNEHPVMRAIGATRRQLLTSSLTRVALIAGSGAALALALAIGASRLMPIGPARLAEPHPGIEVNVAFLGAGAVAIVLAFLAWAFVPALRAASVRAGATGIEAPRGEPSAIASAMRRTGLPAPATIGVQMALEPGRGRTSVPVRSALAGTALAVAALVASLVFGSNLNRMVSEPRSFGWNWDTMLDAQFGVIPTATLRDKLDGDPAVEAWAGGVYGSISIAGREVAAIGIDPGRGGVFPTIIEGRAVSNAGELVLGPRTLREANAKIGDTVDVTINAFGEESGPVHHVQVVGTAVFPSIGRGSFTPTGLGDGAAMVAKLLAESPEFVARQGGGAGDLYNFALVRFRADARDGRARLDTWFRALPTCAEQECGALTGSKRRPADISNYSRVRATPIALAAFLLALAALTVGHTLVTAVRRRRADLAVLKTLGFSQGQLSALVAWQASTYAIVACAIGIPAGVALGRWAWFAFAGDLGVPPDVRIGPSSLIVPLVATFLLANVAAGLPGRTAGRVRPGLALRAE